MGARKIKKTAAGVAASYGLFDQLDGDHPWMKALPNGFVPYQVRELRTGEIAYFNYPLAKEMGLISQDHPHEMNETLKKKLIETFSLQIINEYDEQSGRKFDPASIKPKKYMASRYLQLQHANKQGKTSGDGRGIWNGVIEHRGKIWDVSSRGTGVTCLAPGAVEANRPLQTGGTEFGYGCGKAEIDELYGAALLAEIMHLQGIATERVLCIIDLGKGYGIGVRAAPSLLRPAHIFLYLKQNRKDELKAAMDYFIDRQIRNGRWKPKSRGMAIYEELAEELGRCFAGFTAKLDIDYVFAWLDWDGDNVLADAGIIDYGSVRQFGLRHDRYRYDDVERFSTNLNEQRMKARLIVQVFCQIAHYLRTGQRRSLRNFANHPVILKFNQEFSKQRAHRLLYRMGFNPSQRENILKEKNLFDEFDKVFSYFERAKVSGTVRKVPDGVNHPALFDMRAINRELPAYLLKNGIQSTMTEEDFFRTLLSSFAKMKDTRRRPKHSRKIKQFQELYVQLVKTAAGKTSPKSILPGIAERAKKLNHDNRITGNALIQIVDEILSQRRRGVSHASVQAWIDQLIFSHLDFPEVNLGPWYQRKPRAIPHPDVLEKLLQLVQSYKHDI
jgi:uncharacterized protein YdiU (UPF0061 family)